MPQFEGDPSSVQVDADVPVNDKEMDETTGLFPEMTNELEDKILQDITHQLSSPHQSSAVSDDDFLRRFPAVNFLPTNTEPTIAEPTTTESTTASTSTQQKKKKPKGPQNIAEYLIEEESCSVSEDATEPTEDAVKLTQNTTLKRPRDPTDDAEPGTSKKRMCTDDNTEFATNDISESDLQPIVDYLAKLEEDEASSQNATETSSQSEENEQVGQQVNEINELDMSQETEKLPFPTNFEEINFNVEAMLHGNQGFQTGLMGEQAMQRYTQERALVLDTIKQMWNCLKNAPLDIVEKDPKGLTVPLMPHQRQAMRWMKWREQQEPCSGGILADEMGLGKTFQMIALIVAAKNERMAKLLKKNPHLYYREVDGDDFDKHDVRERYDGRTLVICPPALMEQWSREISSKTDPSLLHVYVYHGPEKYVHEWKLIKYDVILTTYATVAIEYKNYMDLTRKKDSHLFNINWDRIVLDEAHIIRNHRGKTCEAICELEGKKKWAITGTPIQNKEGDFFALLKYLNCTPFTDFTLWNRWVSNNKTYGNRRLVVITKTLMLRRTKEGLVERGVIHPLPDKIFATIDVGLDKEELLVYQKLLLYSQSFFMEYLRQKEEKEQEKLYPRSYYSSNSMIAQHVPKHLSKMMRVLLRHHSHKFASDYLLVLIMRLRQVCCHPALIQGMLDKEEADLDDLEGVRDIERMDKTTLEYINKIIDENPEADEDYDEEFDIDEDQARNIMSSDNPVFDDNRKSSKVRAVLQTIQNILNKGEKVVVVSQWTSFLQVIGNNLAKMPDAKFAVYAGSTKLADRQVMVDRLNDYDDSLKILLLSLTAGAIGLNLVGANNLLLIDCHWNPQLELQAMDRLHRFGQYNPVNIYRFVCKNTIEEKIIALQGKKLKIASKVLDGKVAENLTIEDLATLFS